MHEINRLRTRRRRSSWCQRRGFLWWYWRRFSWRWRRGLMFFT